MFPTEEEEQLVPPDRAAYRKAVVLIARRHGGIGEGIRVLKEFIVIEVVSGAVQSICAGLDGEVRRAAGVVSEFRRASGLEREVFDGIDGKYDAGDRGDAALVHRRNAPPEVVVVSALNLPVDRIRSSAVDAGDAAAAARREPGVSGSPATASA